MQFSNSTTKNGIIQACEFYTGLGDTGISAQATVLDHFTRLVNNRYQEVVTAILDSMDGWDWDDTNHTNKIPIVTRPLIANQTEYLFSTALWSLVAHEGQAAGGNATIKPLKIKRVDVCYDGTGNTCYKAEPVDSGEMGLGLGNDSLTDARFNNAQPFYDVTNSGILLYPRATAANVSNSGILRVEFTRNVDLFVDTDTTQEPGIDEPFHDMLSLGASMDWLMAKKPDSPTINQLAQKYAVLEARLRSYYGKKELDRQIILKPAYVNYE